MSAAPDTIVAGATPPGRGGIGIVRVSGPKTRAIAAEMLGTLPPARHATVAVFAGAGGLTIDVGLALYFPAPNSFTGEDVLELHGHGGPVVMDLLVTRAGTHLLATRAVRADSSDSPAASVAGDSESKPSGRPTASAFRNAGSSF